MSFDISLTGVDDLQQPWKMAFCGFPGSGKTLLASTAPNPYYLFFREHPRYKSVVSRGIPHTKVLNLYEGNNDLLVESVQDRILEIVKFLRKGEHEFETLVVDTGDEMFHAIKEARLAANGGEWQAADWGWLGDIYREIVNAMIDLPMHVIFLFHVKTTMEDDLFVRELALQGAAKDEAAGWFDLVAALESFTVTDEDGNDVSRRFIITQPSRSLPFVKDHSGKLKGKIQISRDFQGDIPVILEELSSAAEDIGSRSEVYKTVDDDVDSEPESVVTESMIKAKKEARKKEEFESVPESPVNPAPGTPTEASSEGSESAGDPTLDEAAKLVEEELGGKEVHICAECGGEVEDENVIEMSKIKFDKVYCKTDFKSKMKS